MPDIDPTLEPQDGAKDSAKLKAVLVLCATLAFVLSPLVTEPFTGFNPEQLPVPVGAPPIQPAGYAFSIWGVIYLWLMVSAGFGMIKRDTDPGWDRARWPLFISLAIGASWIGVALAAPVLATLLIWVMFATAVWALLRMPQSDRGWLALPVGLYAGWLTAASCVALGAVLTGYGVGTPLAVSWAALALALAAAVPLSLRLRLPSYAIAVAWALTGVVVANVGTAPFFAATAGLAALGLLYLAYRSAHTA